MVRQGAGELDSLETLAEDLNPVGHSVQVRVYAEDPAKQFQPSAGLLSHVCFPDNSEHIRIDHWLESGIEVSAFFDPMLAKVIATGRHREEAVAQLQEALSQTELYGIETNLSYVDSILGSNIFKQGRVTTRTLESFDIHGNTVDVIAGGTLTTIQDFPGRTGHWDVGVPPSGPFDDWSFRLGNRLLGNPARAAGLEITLNGPTLTFNSNTRIVLSGADMPAVLNGEVVPFWQVIDVKAGSVLNIGRVDSTGARSYLLVAGGFDCPDYMGSKSTFTLGQFGGHSGRAIRAGDVLRLNALATEPLKTSLPDSLRPAYKSYWNIHVISGPHGAPDFFTENDIRTFFDAEWEVHYNSSRTGIRLIGPKPEWARTDGGEAGMHPSNIHDNAYAIGAIDFTGDMPVILGPDGPSLGGFVCPATVVAADRWMMGQLKAGDKVRFIPVSLKTAASMEINQLTQLEKLEADDYRPESSGIDSPVLKRVPEETHGVRITYRAAGDKYLLIEYGPMVLDIALRFRVHALMLWLKKQNLPEIKELTPGIRSLQVHYDNLNLSMDLLLSILAMAEEELTGIEDLEVAARIVHLPLSWNDEVCGLATEKYMQSVRQDAPWCPDNLEFIRRINGLDSINDVKKIVFDASYLVLGLGDVYLGAPVATPVDPRHRLVTTKYNPARTWTAENSVGIGGSYLCVYGMEGPGGYQFVGRTLQMWNRYHQTKEFEKPWLLRFFDQIRFYDVSAEELLQIRKDFPKGNYPLRIEETSFNLSQYQEFLRDNNQSIRQFSKKRQTAFDEELQRWVESGQISFESDMSTVDEGLSEETIEAGCIAIESHVSGSIWKLTIQEGDRVEQGQVVVILESMKMEIEVTVPESGIVQSISHAQGEQIMAGQRLLVLQLEE